MDLFSSRELATGFWMMVALAFAVYSDSIRPHLWLVIRTFFNFYILTPIIGMGLYIALISYGLIELNIWNLNQYKNVTLWFVCVGTYSLFQIADVNKGARYFKATIADLFKITTIFEFVVAFYSFNFWFEIIFIPCMTFIMVMAAFSDNKKEYKIVSDLLGKVISIIGLCIIIYVCYQIIYEPEEFFNKGTVYDFAVPIVLTIFLFPYLYAFMVYIEYERTIKRLRITFKNEELVKYAKRKIVIAFNVRLSYLKRWDRYVMVHDIKSESDINSSIDRVMYLMRRDRKNNPVGFEKGWSHYDARRYLKEYGLMTAYYDHLYYEQWSSSSEYLKLNEDYFGNRIKYYIDGDEEAIKCLSLVLEVENVDSFDEALDKFRDIGNSLFQKSVGEEKVLNIKTEEVEGESDDLYQTHLAELEGRHIMIQKKKVLNRDAFEIRLSFAVDKLSFKYADTI